MKPIMDISYFTGQRISGVLAIKMSGIDDEGIHFKQGKYAQALGVHATEAMTNRYIHSRATVVAEASSFRQPLDKLDKTGKK